MFAKVDIFVFAESCGTCVALMWRFAKFCLLHFGWELLIFFNEIVRVKCVALMWRFAKLCFLHAFWLGTLIF